MTRIALLAAPFLALPAAAQEGPSFDCGYASTRTEIAICAMPELASLELRMFESYQGLVDRVGQGEAREIADELLARRQACEGDPDCIAERLLISMEVFEQRGRPRDYVADLEPTVPLPDRDGAVSTLVPQEAEEPEAPEVALAEPSSDLPLAAQAPWPEDEELAELEAEAETPPLTDALDDAELASSDGAAGGSGAASFDTPLSWAFMDLERDERARLQGRLTEAGFLEGEADGTWTADTQAALEDFAEAEGSGSFDLSTQTGSALLLDYLGSDAFTAAFGVEDSASAEPVATEPPATELDDLEF